MVLKRPGWLLAGEIARLVDRGYQKFLKTPKMEIPATADHLRAIHEFTEELKQAAGATSLYNESLGTTSDRYVYDRVQGRE
jgi:truncated hemoglobin YjbI